MLTSFFISIRKGVQFNQLQLCLCVGVACCRQVASTFCGFEMFFNSGPKPKENHESWESLFRRTLSKERLFTFTRPTENPIHWIQFLDPFDQQDTRKVCKSTATHGDLAGNEKFPRSRHVSGNKSSQLKVPEAVVALAQAAAKVSGESCAGGSMDVPGWPLIPFSKVRMFKCEKCCLEFCSPMNHRRHLRMIHRRASHSEKVIFEDNMVVLLGFYDVALTFCCGFSSRKTL